MRQVLSVIVTLFVLNAWAEGKSPVVCESMWACRGLPMTFELYEVPAVYFETVSTADITINADVWWTADCPGDPDTSYSAGGVVPPGSWYQDADIGEQPKGTEYSIQWTITGCPALDCVNGIIGSDPDICP